MATPFSLTHQPIRYTTATGVGFQPIYLAVDISSFDLLDMEAGLVAVEGTLTSFTLDLFTSNQNQTDDGWLAIGTTLFTGTTNNTWAKVSYTSGLLRYLRWNVTAIAGGTAATFFIRGLGRSYSAPSTRAQTMMPRQAAMPMAQTVSSPAAVSDDSSGVYMPPATTAPLPFISNSSRYMPHGMTTTSTARTIGTPAIPGIPGLNSKPGKPVTIR